MAKTIKVEDQVYNRLAEFQLKHETFSGAVSRLLDIKDGIAILINHVEGVRKFEEHKAAEIRKVSSPDASRDIGEVSHLPAG